jgi:hypothetical protein
VFTAQKPAAAIAPAHHIASGLRTPPSGIVAVRYGTVRHSSEAYTHLLPSKRHLTGKILGAPGGLSLKAIDFAQKQKVNDLIFYFFIL